ncbi:MAG: beta-ketoacyl-[acyl-carrier-protein] synthase family protein [Lentisphaerae bacterium]|nr:beta-ketoacyl-[acyl-carrier-protein] synthase family protein [Lentisphaerota bacterium]
MSQERLAITGSGLVCCLGSGSDEVYRRLCAGECGIRPIDRFPAEAYPQGQAGQIPSAVEDRLRAEFPDDDLAGALVKDAGREALRQAGRAPGASDARMGLVLATNFGPMEALEWCWRERVDVGSMDASTFARFDGFCGAMAAWLGCGGPRLQLSLSCGSGAAALAAAADLIRQGRADRVLAIGYDLITEFCWCGLTNLRTITTDCMRPFDRERSGTIFSEGAAAMLLESPRASTAPVLGWLAGAATNNNAFHMTAPPKDAEGSRRVMAAALADAGLTPADVDHICAHATSTKANDVTEAGALRNLFGDRLAGLTVAAHKSQLGHLMGAAGLAEAIVTLQVIRGGVIPPTVHHVTPDPECPVDCIPGTARVRKVRCAITNSAGIGGNNSSVVLLAASA